MATLHAESGNPAKNTVLKIPLHDFIAIKFGSKVINQMESLIMSILGVFFYFKVKIEIFICKIHKIDNPACRI